jgi:glycogen debranching enzyme
VSPAAEPHDRFEILAETGLLDDRTLVLKAGDTFAVFDRHGDVQPFRAARHGLFHEGTRFLSRLMLSIDERRPLLLASAVSDAEGELVVDLTNPDRIGRDGRAVPRNAVHIRRTIRLRPGEAEMSLRLRSFLPDAEHLRIELTFDADFIDVFELRGVCRERRGTLDPVKHAAGGLRFGYLGLDGVARETTVSLDPAPSSLDEGVALYPLTIERSRELGIRVVVRCGLEAVRGPARPRAPARRQVQEPEPSACEIASSSPLFDEWIRRSQADLAMMTTRTAWGPYPYAGVPWFSAPFGRDGLITALSTLAFDASLSVGVLRFLAAHQATADRPEDDAEPGKILHEMRSGEMAATREIPFGCYYGSVDVTPLFLVLAAEYHERTADDELISELWPSLEAASGWLRRSGDVDGDGFLEYRRRSKDGLSNHGWKDSHDAVSHADGSLAKGTIALAEVQAYAYAAHRGMARLCRSRGLDDDAAEHALAARTLRSRFHEAFWCEPLRTYALALDGDKVPCRVRASNAGHVLAMGLATPQAARAVAETLFSPEQFSGWGVRTLASDAARFNPMSYHNGSVWPHDNALIARGLARYGHGSRCARLLECLFDASRRFDRARLPELFCGFARVPGEGPTVYPLACAPQSWAAASVFLALQSALGMRIDATQRELRFVRPILPRFLAHLSVRGLAVRDARVDVRVERPGEATGVLVVRQEGEVRVLVES